MCVQCILQCSRAYTFKQLCVKSASILRTYISPDFQRQLKKNGHATGDFDIKEELQEIQVTTENQKQTTPSQSTQITEENNLDVKTLEVDVTETEIQSFSTNATDVDIAEVLPAQMVTFDDGTTGYYMEHVTIVDNVNSNDSTLQEVTFDEEPFTDEINFINTDDIIREPDPLVVSMSPLPPPPEVEPSSVSTSNSPKSKRGKRYKCTKCPLSFSLKIDQKVHMLTHPVELNHRCGVCKKAFAEARMLKRHLKIHFTKTHHCDQCDMSFAESSNLSKHKKKHTGELRNIKGKPHLCSICGRAFKWASSISKHMKYHTGHNLLTCQFCGKQYVEARSLRVHIRTHTGERPHKCHLCPKAFTQSCNLEKHLRVHTGEKPYLCKVCGKGFTQSGYVRIHMRIHTGERPYMCHTCGKSFSGSSTLAVHQQVHSGEKPYECTVCGFKFNRLRAHQKVHGVEKMLPCKQCGKCFTTSDDLDDHTMFRCWKGAKVETVRISDLLTGETVHTVQVQAADVL